MSGSEPTAQHLARELHALRGAVEDLVQVTKTQVVPALSSLSDRVSRVEVRVERLEIERIHADGIRPSVATPLAIAFLVTATVGVFVGVVLLFS